MDDEEVKSFFISKKKWSESEKRSLLKGLKKYGSDNVEKLKTLLPNKSTSSISQMIKKYQTIAELGKKDTNSPIDIWLRSGIFSGKNPVISEALLYIYLFEDHPPPEETAGFDIKRTYKYLYEATKGQPVTNLSQRTRKLFRKLMLTVDQKTWPVDECYTTDYLISKLCKIESDKTYKRKKQN